MVAVLNRIKTSEFIVDSFIKAAALCPSQKEKVCKVQKRHLQVMSCEKEITFIKSPDASVEGGLLREGAANPPDDDVGGVVSGSDALLQDLLLDQC